MTKASDTANILKQPFTNTLGTSSYRAGVNAGNSIASGGNFNTVVGDEAGTALTTGDDNTAFGYGALYSEDAHGKNTAVGTNSLLTLNAGVDGYNTAVGYFSGKLITTGIENTLIGSRAGDALTDADYNVAVGDQSLSADTQGSKSTAVGHGTLFAQNFTSATDSFNTAVGYQAGLLVTTGTSNTLIGALAGDALTTGTYNTVLGQGALGSDDVGNTTTAIGYYALHNQNFSSSTSSYNTAVGYNALFNLTTAQYNTTLGYQAGYAITTGENNTLLGHTAGDNITDGAYNTAVGFATMTHDRNTNGNRNTVIGAFADTSAADSDDQIILGYNVIGTGNNAFTFGKDGTDSNIDFGATSITAPSDERYKEEITTSTAGLSFINDLRPVTFKWKKEKDIPTDHKSYVKDSDTRVMGRGEKIQHGFIAQEVKTVIDNHSEIKDGFEMWSTDTNDGRQRLAPSELIPMLVKAIQELSAEVKTLKGE